jgi:hypothetical protein
MPTKSTRVLKYSPSCREGVLFSASDPLGIGARFIGVRRTLAGGIITNTYGDTARRGKNTKEVRGRWLPSSCLAA